MYNPTTASSATFFGMTRLWPCLILAVALATRLWGIDWQLPAALYFDEMKYVEWANRAVGGGPQLVADLRNPTVYHRILQVEYALASLARTDRSDEETSVFRLALARVTSAFMGAVACLLTGLAAAALVANSGRGTAAGSPELSTDDAARRRLQAALAGLAAGCMLAFSLLHVHMSHYALNDATASAFLAASLLFGTRAINGGRRDLLLAGLLAGLAFTTKYNFGVILLLPLAVATVVRPRSVKPGAALDAETTASGMPSCGAVAAPWRNWARRRSPHIALVIGAFIVSALLSMPELTLTPRVVTASLAEQARLGTMRWSGQSADPIVQLYFETLWHGLGWPVLLAAVVGAVSLAQRDRTALAVQLAVPMGCLLVMLRQELFFARFALPLLPSLTIFAGLGLVEIATRVVGRAAGRQGALAMTDRREHVRSSIVVVAATVALVVVTLVPVTARTIRHNQLATTTDTRAQARQWLNRNVSRGRVVTESYGVPIAWSGGERSRRYQLQRSSALVNPTTVTRQACEGARYFLVASLTSERELVSRGASSRESGYDVLAHRGRVVTTFDPFWPGMSAPAHPDNTGIPFWYLEAYARPGPKITVYELSEGAVSCTR